MNTRERALLAMAFYDACIGAWFSIWWIKVFAELLSAEILSTSRILQSLMGILALYWVIKKCEIPSCKSVFVVWMVSYAGLFALLGGPQMFLLISTVMSVVCGAFWSAFGSALKVQNVTHRTRNRFDNLSSLMFGVGGVIGGSVAFFYQAQNIPFWVIWLTAYVLFDLDFLVQILLIKKGFFSYDRDYNAVL